MFNEIYKAVEIFTVEEFCNIYKYCCSIKVDLIVLFKLNYLIVIEIRRQKWGGDFSLKWEREIWSFYSNKEVDFLNNLQITTPNRIDLCCAFFSEFNREFWKSVVKSTTQGFIANHDI